MATLTGSEIPSVLVFVGDDPIVLGGLMLLLLLLPSLTKHHPRLEAGGLICQLFLADRATLLWPIPPTPQDSWGRILGRSYGRWLLPH